MAVVGRFAPTPSGRMHLGNVFAALIAWLSVRSQKGQLVLRMETASPRAEEYRALYRFCMGGLALLASQYPEYISIQTDLE